MDKRVTVPQVLGHEMSGHITEVGPEVKGFVKGDRVVVRPLDSCGRCPACRAGHAHICQNLKFLGIDTPGAFQAYWTVPAHTLHRLPDSVSLEHGALIEPLAVACHDVRLGRVRKGDYAVVIGGGPIGLLNALVARSKGANVLVSEISPFRRRLTQEFGLNAVDPRAADLVGLVESHTDGAGADIVFEVSGSAEGAAMMTKLPRTRGRIVVVAIFSEPPKIDLFRCFWRELQIIGVRVYEPEDFEEAISIAGSGAIPLDRLVSAVRPLDALKETLDQMTRGAEMMKVLFECS
jgi:2-desacetyl-2-hydroxyethyl bacteriochlorophyllide A dehydrogenase